MKKYLGQMKIFQKLMLSYLCVCLIPLTLAGTVIYKVSARNMEATYMELATIFNSQIVTNMNEFAREYDRATESILVDFDVIHKLSEEDGKDIGEKLEEQLNMRRIMMRLLTLKPEIKEIMLLTATGRVYQVGNGGRAIDGSILKEQEWLRDFRDSGDILSVTAVHDKAYYEEQKDGLTITVCRRILDYKGAYVGELLLDLDPGSLIQLNDDFLLARNQYNIKICITDDKNGILFDSDVVSGRVTWQEAVLEHDVLMYERNPSDYIVMSNATADGKLLVSIVIPRSDLLLRISKVKYIACILMLGCVLITCIISFILSKNIADPIRELQDKMKKVEKGSYEPFQYKPCNYEINNLICSYNNMVERIKDLIEKVFLSEIRQKNAKLLALQTQINPHMLYNTLEAIRMKAIINDEDEIADMIKIMAQMFRMALHDHAPFYTIKKDMEYAQHFVALQNIRLPDVFRFEVRLDKGVEEASIIPLLIQPLVENSIEHGYRGGNAVLHMLLTGRIVGENDISITLQDDGKGMTKEQVLKVEEGLPASAAEKLLPDDKEIGNSIGLRNIAERIRLYYGENYYLRIVRSDGAGTVVEIRIPGRWEKDGGGRSNGMSCPDRG